MASEPLPPYVQVVTRRVLTTALVLAAVAAAPLVRLPAASAAPGWRSSADLAGRSVDYVTDPDVAVSADGHAVAVWVFAPEGTSGVVMMSRRAPGGTFGPPVAVSGNQGLADRDARLPQVGIADDGSALLAWIYANGTNDQVRYRSVTPGGALGPVRDATPVEQGYDAWALDLAVNGAGRIAMTWATSDRPYGATGSIALGVDAADPLVAPGDVIYQPGVGIDAAGDAVFVWERDVQGGIGHFEVESRAKPVGQPLGQLTVHDGAGADQRAEGPSVAVAPDGRAVVAYGYRPATNAAPSVRYAVRGVGGGFAAGTWSGSDLASQPGQATSTRARAALLPDGTAVLAYTDAAQRLWTATRSGGGFGSYQQLSGPAAKVEQFDLRAGPSGAVALLFVADSGAQSLSAAVRPAGATQFGAVTEGLETVSPPAFLQAPLVVLDDQGNATGVYQSSHCTGTPTCRHDYAVRSVVFDAAAPALSSVSIPSAVVARRKGTFSVSASDRLSTPVVTWSFGDGATGQGAAVQHVYEKKGAVTVTVSAADANGTTASLSRSVKVLPPAVRAKLKAAFGAGKKATTVRTLTLQKVRRGARIVITCRGGGCPFKKVKGTAPRPRGVPLADFFGGRSLRPGAVVTVTVSAKKATGRYFAFTVARGAKPQRSDGCVGPGGSHLAC
jgi:hypothetical protein